jgi:hypothetical protein
MLNIDRFNPHQRQFFPNIFMGRVLAIFALLGPLACAIPVEMKNPRSHDTSGAILYKFMHWIIVFHQLKNFCFQGISEFGVRVQPSGSFDVFIGDQLWFQGSRIAMHAGQWASTDSGTLVLSQPPTTQAGKQI